MCKSSLSVTRCYKCKMVVSRDKDIDIMCIFKKQIERAQRRGSDENVEELEALCKEHAIEVSGPIIRLYGCKYC